MALLGLTCSPPLREEARRADAPRASWHTPLADYFTNSMSR